MNAKSIALALIFATATPSLARAAVVFETTGWVVDSASLTFPFIADQTPLTYEVTLSDLSEAPSFGFDSLFLSLTTTSGEIANLSGPGSFRFTAVQNETYNANILATGGGDLNAGLYGLEVVTVPVPPALLIFVSALAGLGCRRRISTAIASLSRGH